ncbi:hypothetical protein ALCH109712_16880 [Alkalicoccus chagannorensis]
MFVDSIMLSLLHNRDTPDALHRRVFFFAGKML